MTTAAEKFDLVPPWCVVKKAGVQTWCVQSHDGMCRVTASHMVWFCPPSNEDPYILDEALARRIARLTRPLDSWEPADDCPLPVEGWNVVFVPVRGVYRLETHTGPHTFTSRRAAYVWAWTEAEAPDENGAKDGPSDDRGTLGWAAFDELCKTTDHSVNALDDRIGAVETKVEDMADVLARICPEADSQTDGKDRTLVEIDGKIDRECARIHELVRGLRADVDHAQHTADAANERIDKISGRVIDAEKNNRDLYDRAARNERLSNKTGRPLPSWPASEPAAEDPIAEVGHKLNMVRLSTIAETDTHITVNKRHWAELRKSIARLSAAQVAKPATLATRSDDASTNELATAAAAVDEGWREQLVPVSFTHENSLMWWMTPDRKAYTGHCLNPSTDWGSVDSTLRDFVVVTDNRKDDPVYLAVRSKVAPPPNLAEWYKPKAAAFRDTAAVNADTLKDYDAACAAVPSTYRVGDDLAAWVRNLASAHATALQYQRELERKLADANTAAVAAEGRAATAVKRASKAEEELADLRGKVENLRAAFSG